MVTAQCSMCVPSGQDVEGLGRVESRAGGALHGSPPCVRTYVQDITLSVACVAKDTVRR